MAIDVYFSYPFLAACCISTVEFASDPDETRRSLEKNILGKQCTCFS